MPSFFYMSQPTLVLFLKKSEIYSRQTPSDIQVPEPIPACVRQMPAGAPARTVFQFPDVLGSRQIPAIQKNLDSFRKKT